MRELNKIYCDDWLNNDLPDKCAKVLICDPPYFEVKGEFDFIWKTFEDYLADVEKWAIECKRVLADNGTLFWYGDRKKIAYSQIILDKYFNLEENITIHIFDRQTNKIRPEDATSFINVTERLLMYSNEVSQTGLEKIKLDTANFKTLRNYFENLHNWIDISLKKINTKLGHRRSEHAFYYNSTQWDLPTEETYNELIKYFSINNFAGFQEYEALRQEYEALRRPFSIQERYKTNVLRISQEGHKTAYYDHATVKPEKLTRILINACSRKDDLVIIPFSGSGTECAMSAKEGRPFIGFDTKQKYVNMGNKRVNKIVCEPTLFCKNKAGGNKKDEHVQQQLKM